MTTESRDAETQVNSNPGLAFYLWPKAYEHAAQRVVDKVFEAEALTNAYRCYIESQDAQVTQVVKPTLRIEIDESQLIWKAENGSVAVRGKRRYLNGEETFEKSITGSLNVHMVVARAGPFYEPIYSAKVYSDSIRSSCSSQGTCGIGFNVVDICNANASNNNNSLYVPDYTGIRKRTSSEALQQNDSVDINSSDSTKRSKNDATTSGGNDPNSMICPIGSRTSDGDLGETLIGIFSKALLECMNDQLPDHALPIGSRSDWMFDFNALTMPRFHNGCMRSTHSAAYHYSDIQMLMRVGQAHPFPKPENSGRMLTIFISNYIFNTIGFCLHEYKILSYNLTQADLIPPATQDNSATNTPGKIRHLSDCFPLSFYGADASVEVKLASTKAPTANFCGQNLKITIVGSAIFRVHLPSGGGCDFLTTDVSLEVTVLLKFNLRKVTGTVTSIVPMSVTVVENDLGTVCSREVLMEAFDLIATQFLRRKFEKLMDDGIPLPRPLLSGVEEFENVVASSSTAAGDYLRIDTDLKFIA